MKLIRSVQWEEQRYYSWVTVHLIELSIIERFNISYSQKNIPIPTEKQYKIQLLSKAENLVKRMRWKALELLEKLDNYEIIDN